MATRCCFKMLTGCGKFRKFDAEGKFKEHLSVEEIIRLDILDDEGIGGLDGSYRGQ